MIATRIADGKAVLITVTDKQILIHELLADQSETLLLSCTHARWRTIQFDYVLNSRELKLNYTMDGAVYSDDTV